VLTEVTTHATELRKRFELAKALGKSAGKTALEFYQKPNLAVETKLDKSIVTEADTRIEVELRLAITREFPRDAILGEEGGASHGGTSGFEWILDPIDGTEAFARGVPLFGTLIGITFEKQPVIGVVEMPALGERYYAQRGQGAFWESLAHPQPQPAHASTATELSKALFTTTSRSGFERAGCPAVFDELLRTAKKFRGWGSCYGHMLVATGRADLMIDPDVKIWDLAAVAPIVTEAGGLFWDMNGEARIDTGGGISGAAGLATSLRSLLKFT
jgi:histidinol-phosphatase